MRNFILGFKWKHARKKVLERAETVMNVAIAEISVYDLLNADNDRNLNRANRLAAIKLRYRLTKKFIT